MRNHSFRLGFGVLETFDRQQKVLLTLFKMRLNCFVFVAFGVVSLASALPAEDSGAFSLLKRVVSPDETCGDVSNGDNNGFTCDATVNEGGCCVSCEACDSLLFGC